MADVTEYSLGTPCWFELCTTDQNSAKAFFGRLFGWTARDIDMGPAGVYTIFQLNGRDTGAVYTMPPNLVEKGAKPHWNVYFSTPDVDATAARVTTLGGAVMQPPFDVMDSGRMVNCKDPGGAMFALWQPKQHRGAGVLNENNAVCWSELATWDTAQAREFYATLFGWQTKPSANMPTYFEFSTGGQPRGGLLPMNEEWKGAPSQWGIYVMVADCDATAAKVRELGGAVCVGPFSAPGVGRLAMLADPQGAGFSVITLQTGG